ncbi:MAG: ABC transporter permease [Deltaproteobacteria bacterium]|nr:ABC transporter permease [Deltaproteobacteria bacterium]
MPPVSLQTSSDSGGILTMAITGRLDSMTTGGIWREAFGLLEKTQTKAIVLDASGITYCDGSGIGFIFDLRRRLEQAGGKMTLLGLQDEFTQLLDFFDPEDFKEATGKPSKGSAFEEIGRAAAKLWSDLSLMVSFVGEVVVALVGVARHPGSVRWKDVFFVMEASGVNALPIVALVSFLLGLVMSFQAAIPMRMFAAEIFIANLVALSTLRELGPLMTAILLAGRTGSAFAAELGAMKVNEEIDALVTMGLDPVPFLAVPRILATVFVTPLLAIFANLFGLIGGGVVMLSLGFPLITYVHRVTSAVTYGDLLGGLLKSLVFGLLVAAVGCMRGLQTKIGATAVGDSATSSVVGGIILIIVADGIFSVMFYYLGV